MRAKGPVSRIYLVSCVGMKRLNSCPAKDLYISPWFRLARQYVEAKRQPWFILSAKYGLVDPDRVIEPYEQTLNRMRIHERREWAKKVEADLIARMPEVRTAIFLAGDRYREFLADGLNKRGVQIEVPMAGLRIGEQLQWLSAKIAP